jgi:ApbE superfamily uncharacterized protein (UPF0280 family)
MTQFTVNASASEFTTFALSIEDWMLEASEQADVALTAHAIANAATDALVDAQAVLAMYANGFDINVREFNACCSALKNVLAWTRTVAA